MKKIAFIFATLCFTTTLVHAQKTNASKAPVATQTAAAQPKVQGPVITFNNTTYDYGTVAKGSSGSGIFKFKNTGNEPLILMQVSPSCGCTVPTWSSEPVMPGKEGSIPVNYTHMHTLGTFSKSITVRSNSATNGTLVLTIKGNIVESAQ